MTDIELVIKIHEDTYKDIIKNGFIYDEDNEVVTHAIKNGTPLPKGHGRVLDEKDILDIEKNKGWMYDLFDMPDYIADVSAIIEADKSESEDNNEQS